MAEPQKKVPLSQRIGVRNPRQKAEAVLPNPPVQQPAEQSKPKKDKSGKPQAEVITYICNHSLPAATFHGQLCPTCRDAGRKAKLKKRREKNEQKHREAMESGNLDWKNPQAGRLPHGSFFTLEPYDAEKELWKGTLTIVVHSPPLVFSGESSGLFHLEKTLDYQYRCWLEARRKEKAEQKQE